MNKIEEAVMYCKLKKIDKKEYYSTYFNCILTRREFDRIYEDKELYKEYLKKESKENLYGR